MAHRTETILGHAAIPSWKTVALTAGLLAALQLLRWVALALYNLYWHPLRHFPSHVPWVVLPWGHTVARIRGKVDFQMRELHDKLGPVVRTGPDSLSFTTSAAWKDIYGGGHAELPKHLLGGSGLDELPDIIAANAANHRRYRRALAPAFTTEALNRQEPLISTHVDVLLQKLTEIAHSPEPVADMTSWYSMVSFDIFGDLCYGENFGGLELGRKSPWIQAISDTKPVIALMVIPYISKLLLHLYLSAGQRDSLRVSQQMTADATMKRIGNEEFNGRGDIMSFVLRSRGDAKGLTDFEVCCNVDTIMGAAVDTTVIGLTGVTYCLVRHPEALERCTREVREAFADQSDICFKDIDTRLPFLLACINEGLRLYPPTPIGLWRRTLPGPPTSIGEYEVPENTVVSVHQLAAYHSERNFHNARTYAPQRWLPEELSDPASPFRNDDHDSCRPFSYGPRNCIGRNLAMTELKYIIAKILWRFDLHLEAGFENWPSNQRSFQQWQLPDMKIRLEERIS